MYACPAATCVAKERGKGGGSCVCVCRALCVVCFWGLFGRPPHKKKPHRLAAAKNKRKQAGARSLPRSLPPSPLEPAAAAAFAHPLFWVRPVHLARPRVVVVDKRDGAPWPVAEQARRLAARVGKAVVLDVAHGLGEDALGREVKRAARVLLASSSCWGGKVEGRASKAPAFTLRARARSSSSSSSSTPPPTHTPTHPPPHLCAVDPVAQRLARRVLVVLQVPAIAPREVGPVLADAQRVRLERRRHVLAHKACAVATAEVKAPARKAEVVAQAGQPLGQRGAQLRV